MPGPVLRRRSSTDWAFSVFAQNVIERLGNKGLQGETMLASTDVHGERQLRREIGCDCLAPDATWGGTDEVDLAGTGSLDLSGTATSDGSVRNAPFGYLQDWQIGSLAHTSAG